MDECWGYTTESTIKNDFNVDDLTNTIREFKEKSEFKQKLVSASAAFWGDMIPSRMPDVIVITPEAKVSLFFEQSIEQADEIRPPHRSPWFSFMGIPLDDCLDEEDGQRKCLAHRASGREPMLVS